ncbi:flagellar filament capping protein FliD [Litchfieldia alkalitelluris]|uniref:flagellar filament capping protein FliD n=1 Tax=Litchfieldia alkalitelluris TaxID=304268 RepID=UPI001F2C94B5|nr:flagellar filament capping protein FliD [Litchfieldia alkalitelluris]
MNMRIGGLASGMDTETIIKDLMKAERMPLDKLKQKKQVLEWQRSDYRAMNTLLLDFRSELTNMRLSTKYRARTTTSTNSDLVSATATSAASQASYSIEKVTRLASAATKGTPDDPNNPALSTLSGKTLDRTKGLFNQQDSFLNNTNSPWKVGVVETKDVKVSTETNVVNLGVTGATFEDTLSWSVKVNGTAYKVIDSGTPAAGQVLVGTDGNLTFKDNIAKDSTVKVDYITTQKSQEISSATATKTFQLAKGSINTVIGNQFTVTTGDTVETYSVALNADGNMDILDSSSTKVGELKTESGQISFSSKEFAAGSKLNITYNQNYTTFALDTSTSTGAKHESFILQGNESLDSMISKVNNSAVGVTAFYDSTSDKMTLTRKETGHFDTNGEDEIRTSGVFINETLKFGGVTEAGGTNAEFKINGIVTSRPSNTFEMSGVTFTLKNLFSYTAETAVQITVSNDTNQVFENIKGFVDKYNELISKISGKISEEKYRDFNPLTDEERESLSDKQQEQWEEKAKSGLLRRDSTLSSLLSSMRNDLYSPVNNAEVSSALSQLASIGITTTSNYMEGGKLQIDEAKLKKAIAEDPTSVEKLFNATGTGSSEMGVMQRLTDTVNASMEKLREKAGNAFSTNQQFAIGRNLLNVDSQINKFERRMIQVEDRYWKQFTAMEKALQRSNDQYNYLMQQFSY